MTSTPPETLDARQDRAQNILDWITGNTRALTIGAVVVAAAGAGYWFYARSTEMKKVNAERALLTAKQSIMSGNTPLAQTDLQKVVTRYSGTTAGVEAAMLLAQLSYDQGKYQEGIASLQKVLDNRWSGPSLASLYSLVGDGYSQMGKPEDAAKQYLKAADATAMKAERTFQKAKAARAYVAAGKTDDARKLWTELSTQPESETVAAEAKVRLAELDAKPAGKS